MHGDYDEPDSSQLGHFDWPVAALAALVVVLGVFSFFAAGCVQGAEPTFTVVNRVPPAFTVVNRIPAKTAPKLIGWNYTQPDGSVVFVPVQQPTAPAGPMTYPAPGVAVSPPFAEGAGSWGAGPTTTGAPIAAPINLGWSPAGRTFPAIPTGVRTRSVAPGGLIRDCPT